MVSLWRGQQRPAALAPSSQTLTLAAVSSVPGKIGRDKPNERALLWHVQTLAPPFKAISLCTCPNSAVQPKYCKCSGSSSNFSSGKECGLTIHSSGPPTACRTSQQAQGLRPILRLLSGTPRCRGPLNSNVRQTRVSFVVLQQNQRLAAWAKQPRGGRAASSPLPIDHVQLRSSSTEIRLATSDLLVGRKISLVSAAQLKSRKTGSQLASLRHRPAR